MSAEDNPFTVDDDGTLIYKNGKRCGLIMKEVDGSYYWWPGVDMSGMWSAATLIEIGQLLNSMNADWDKILREEL